VIPRLWNLFCGHFGTPCLFLRPAYTVYEDGKDSVPKRRQIQFRRWEVTQKKEYTKDRKQEKQKWTPFTYFSPLVRNVTNIFKDTEIKIAYRSTNTIFKQLAIKPDKINNPSGIYSIRCITCNNEYVGQSNRDIQIRYKEHINQIRNCNPQSAYANHILQNRHEFGPAKTTLRH